MSLTACQSTPIVRTETIKVPVARLVTLDARLTAQEPVPARPANRCVDAQGRATLCNRDLADWLVAYDAALARINARMAQVLGLQPEGP